jgi:hypothetical protein
LDGGESTNEAVCLDHGRLGTLTSSRLLGVIRVRRSVHY